MEILVWLAIGMVLGFFIGRGWAENRRGRFDQRAVWNGRKKYRSKD